MNRRQLLSLPLLFQHPFYGQEAPFLEDHDPVIACSFGRFVEFCSTQIYDQIGALACAACCILAPACKRTKWFLALGAYGVNPP